MKDLETRLAAVLDDKARTWLGTARDRLQSEGAGVLPVLLPALARKTGRASLGGGVVTAGDRKVDLDAWRACDAGGFLLIEAAEPSDAVLVDLFLHGDFEERTIVMRSLALQAIRPATVELLGEAQRTNTQVHFEACVCDSNLLARAFGREGFSASAANKILLKGAFVDLPLARFFDILDHANEELTRMITGLATEREAAGRAVWADTNTVIAAAPIEGSAERLAKG